MSQAYKSVNFFVWLKSAIQAQYSYFSHSSVRMDRFKEVFHVLEKRFVRLQKLYDIRWLSRLQTVKAVVMLMKHWLHTLKMNQTRNVAAEGLAKQLTS